MHACMRGCRDADLLALSYLDLHTLWAHAFGGVGVPASAFAHLLAGHGVSSSMDLDVARWGAAPHQSTPQLRVNPTMHQCTQCSNLHCSSLHKMLVVERILRPSLCIQPWQSIMWPQCAQCELHLC